MAYKNCRSTLLESSTFRFCRDTSGGMVVLKNIKLPKPLPEFIESTKQRLLAETDTTRVEHTVELIWNGMIWPSYTNIIIYAFGSGSSEWVDRCIELRFELDGAKPEALFDCVPGPFLSIECCSEQKQREENH